YLSKKVDKRYKLHIAGRVFGSPEGVRYFNYINYFAYQNQILENIMFYGFVDDINSFLEDKNYILSTSMHEGHPYNIMEAMARGIKPIIHNYHGSKEQWPNELIYNFVWEIEDMIKGDYDSNKYRSFVEENYSLEAQIRNICQILWQV
ncbi:MAG: glycosyltransferase, partial [Fervidobacterium sp.]